MSNITDTLMRHPVATQEDEEAKAYRLAELQQAKAEWVDLDMLLKSRGWAISLDKLKRDEMDLLAKLELSQDPTTLAKLVGSLLANRGQQVWPERRKADLEQVIRDLEAQ